jgi:hypothetical protein
VSWVAVTSINERDGLINEDTREGCPILTILGPSSTPAPSCIIGREPLLTDSLQHHYLRPDHRRRKTQREPIFLAQSSTQQYKSGDAIRTLDLFDSRVWLSADGLDSCREFELRVEVSRSDSDLMFPYLVLFLEGPIKGPRIGVVVS